MLMALPRLEKLSAMRRAEKAYAVLPAMLPDPRLEPWTEISMLSTMFVTPEKVLPPRGGGQSPRHSLGSGANFEASNEGVLKDDGRGVELPPHGPALRERIARGRLRVHDHRRHCALALQRHDTEGVAAEDKNGIHVGVCAARGTESTLRATGIRERKHDRRGEVADLFDSSDLVLEDRGVRAVARDGNESRHAADVRLEVRMADRHVGRFDRLRLEIRGGRDDLGDLLRVLPVEAGRHAPLIR